MCKSLRNEIVNNKEIYYAFPKPEAIINNDLSKYKLGYREKYIKEAANKIANAEFDLDSISQLSNSDALKELKTLTGVGDKVANCILLYGYNKLNSFPIDIWMKKIINEQYDGKIDIASYGNYAGLIQQYMFYYYRTKNLKK